MRTFTAFAILLPSLVFAQQKGVVFGIVVDERDELVLKCRVQLFRVEEGKEKLVATTTVRGVTSFLCDGFFTFFDVAPGNYTLRVLGKYLTQIEEPKLTVGEGQFLFVPLRVRRVEIRPGTLRGTVLIGRESIQGLTVCLIKRGERKPFTTVTTDKRGKYEFKKIEPGEYIILVRHKGTRLASQDVEVVPGRTTTKNIKLPEKVIERLRGYVYGEVRDSKTRRPLRASVRIEKAPPDFRGRKTVRCNDKGKFEFGYLPPGRYTFIASASGYEEERRTLNVRERGRHRLNFSLSPRRRK